MKNLLKKILAFFSSNSVNSIDREICYYRKIILENKIDISHLSDLEQSIYQTTDIDIQNNLKIVFKDELELIINEYHYEQDKGSLNDAW